MKPETEAWVAAAEVDFRLAERAAGPPEPIPDQFVWARLPDEVPPLHDGRMPDMPN